MILFRKHLHASTVSERHLGIQGLCWLLPRLHRQQQEVWDVLAHAFSFPLRFRRFLYQSLQEHVLEQVAAHDECATSSCTSDSTLASDSFTCKLLPEAELALRSQLLSRLSAVLDHECLALELEHSFPITLSRCFIVSKHDAGEIEFTEDIAQLLNCASLVWLRLLQSGRTNDLVSRIFQRLLLGMRNATVLGSLLLLATSSSTAAQSDLADTNGGTPASSPLLPTLETLLLIYEVLIVRSFKLSTSTILVAR